MLSNYTIKMQFKGVLHPEMPDILFFLISRYFYNLNFKYVHILQLKLQFNSKIKKNNKKNSQGGGGCATPPNVPKLGVSGVKDAAKTNKDLGMSCCILLEYSVFYIDTSLYEHLKIIFKTILKILKKIFFLI